MYKFFSKWQEIPLRDVSLQVGISLLINFVVFYVNPQITLITFYGLVVVGNCFQACSAKPGNFNTITVSKLACKEDNERKNTQNEIVCCVRMTVFTTCIEKDILKLIGKKSQIVCCDSNQFMDIHNI